ncbi:hypothetical protein NL676_022998 [Syzygium grande]|nr:hypothetical protein NL676_022998 [Syzygium grande]
MHVGAVRGDIIGGPSPLIPDASCPHHRIPPPLLRTPPSPAHSPLTKRPLLPPSPPSDDLLLSRTQADLTAAIGINQFSGKESTRSNSIVSDWGKPKNGSKGSSSAWVKWGGNSSCGPEFENINDLSRGFHMWNWKTR